MVTERHQTVEAADGGAVTNVLAIDFLNILVRAFHAGAPTETHAVRSMFQTISGAVKTLRPRHIVFALDGGHKHRTALLPTYKAHRPPSDPALVKQKELAEQALMVAGFQAIRIIDFEADDVIASLATAHKGTVVCSSDKDLLALCGVARVFHPWSGGSFVTPEEKLGIPAGQVTDYLALCGDTSDGIPGVKGIGPKTALSLLTEFGSLECILTAATLDQIKGANGTKLKDNRAYALRSREIVELKTALPLPALQAWHPPAGYQQQLQSMGLGNVAAILDALQIALDSPGESSGDRFAGNHTIAPTVRLRQSPRSLFDEEQTEKTPKKEVLPSQSAETGKSERDVAESVDRAPQDERRQESGTPAEPVTSAGSTSTLVAPTNAGGIASSGKIIDLLTGLQTPPPVAQSSVTANYEKAGFTVTKESPPVPGTNLKCKHFATWRDGSRWLLDQNTRRHTCISDIPVTTDWRMDSRGPIDPATNSVRALR